MSDNDLGFRTSIEGRDEVLKKLQQAFHESDMLDKTIQNLELDKIEQLQDNFITPDIIKDVPNVDRDPSNVIFEPDNIIPQTSNQKHVFNQRFIDENIPVDTPVNIDISVFKSPFPDIMSIENNAKSVLNSISENILNFNENLKDYINGLDEVNKTISSDVRDVQSTFFTVQQTTDDDLDTIEIDNNAESLQKLSTLYNFIYNQKNDITEISEKIVSQLDDSSQVDNIVKTLDIVFTQLSSVQSFIENQDVSTQSSTNVQEHLSDITTFNENLNDITKNTANLNEILDFSSEKIDFMSVMKDIRSTRNTINDISDNKMSRVFYDKRDILTQRMDTITQQMIEYAESNKMYRNVLENAITNIKQLNQNSTDIMDISQNNTNQTNIQSPQINLSGSNVSNVNNQVSQSSIDQPQNNTFTKIIYQGRVTTEANILRVDNILIGKG